MGLTNLLPRTINTTGVSCTGVDGAADRTYSLPDSGIVLSGMEIVVNGTTLHLGASNDYTIADNVITFLNVLWDDSIITMDYFVVFGTTAGVSLLTSSSLRYATPLMLAETLGIAESIPSWADGTDPVVENVGTGNSSDTTFYLDKKSVISDTYTIYYGPDADTLTALTDVTHYALDNDTGKIVLSGAGVTAVADNKIYAEYQYYNNGMKDSFIVATIARAEKEVDGSVNSTFTDGTQTNPAYPLEEEIQSSEGIFNDRIISKLKPLIDVECTLDGSITDSDATISLTNGQGATLPSSGYIIVGGEVITYTGISSDDLTGCSRGVLGTTAAAHDDLTIVHSTILFRSNTMEGSAVSWTVQPWDTSMHANDDGLIYVFKDADPSALSRVGVANRIKLLYFHGYPTVPEDITRLTLIFSKRMLVQDNIGKAMLAGRNEFKPEMFNADMNEMERIINHYIIYSMGNT